MLVNELEYWYLTPTPMANESISHFMGRFRRENQLSVSMLATITGLGGAIARWEKFRLNPPPTQKELDKLAELVRLDTKDLQLMLPLQGTGMKLEPIRLYPSCYIESPCHQIQWQFKTSDRCFAHNLTLLSECPFCGARFRISSQWEQGCCHRCFSSFESMINYQKPL
ncbi:hypothetical protein GM3708_3306 [Geminocystis sp. NIES-3708]|uniref:TniQ family protein n=1 Tax=Geminocystis sp. NIES-3708 TaxID=1615909 RepID=UPI0005FC8681|nr:TniQ family protein [Geminocystis sp. NIES-3708]BAQ62900.1 hypothetical protein GM3708_3306 [Geminocystis sp. NIES-3708]